MSPKGVVAAGHPATAAAAAAILEDGGNAFDASLAALCAACVAEPVLTSLGGGGFLLARPQGGAPVLYDFFAQTPRRHSAPEDVDFGPILADFGTAQQEFHIGMGSMATPGTVKGLFAVHRELGSVPMAHIVEPAAALARGGVEVNRLQAYIFQVVGKIYTCNETCRAHFGSPADRRRLIGEGDTFVIPDLATTLEELTRDGEDLFYRGAIAKRIVADCAASGGTLSAEDLAAYRVIKRQPLSFDYGGARLHTNPPPSTGGILVAFALALLAEAGLAASGFGTASTLGSLARVMDLTNKARLDSRLGDGEASPNLLDAGFLNLYRRRVAGRPAALRGTTHISVIDGHGNAAALSMSNGEGSGYMVPGSGIMLNNMLGEEDINPRGFHRWPEDVRMCSMMAPTLVDGPAGRLRVMGSGGSNRIRTAILQVLLNLLEFGMSVDDAVTSPRIHFEQGLLSIEPGFDADQIEALCRDFARSDQWDAPNLFFGGVHSVEYDPAEGRFGGAGDARRGGVARLV